MTIVPEQNWIRASESTNGAPYFRRLFKLTGLPKSAELLISGLGYYEAWINGQKVGDHVLDPAQTDYERRVFYVRYDVTNLIHQGENILGVILGNGWYNQNKVWGQDGLSYGQPRLMAELHLRDESGKTEIVRADETWRWTTGPIVDNNIYAGECYDARLEMDGWSSVRFDDSTWKHVSIAEPPGGELQEQSLAPMRRIEELEPVAIRKLGERTFTVDFGQNFSGWARIQIQAETGTEIVLRFAESISSAGTIDTASTGVFATKVEQIDRYICSGNGVEIWEPRFTYHGFRYVEVKGWPGELSPEHITGVVVHTDFPVAGGFECSDERLNTLHQMALWTHRSNAHGIPEDCPARERCGWLGDANLVAEYSLWNYDSKSFWEKFLDDIETTRAGNNGIPCCIAPGKRGTGGNANPDWAAAFIMVPWYVYQFSGDTDVLRKHWQGLTQLMDHFKETSEDWVLHRGYGDFFDPGTDAIVQHTPIPLTSTLWFYQCANVMSEMSEVLGDREKADMYRYWKKAIADKLRASFYDEAAGSFGSQGGDVLALAFNVLPAEKERLVVALVNDIKQRDTHMNVGVMGVRYILEVLTDNGFGELALALMHQNSYPSFGHLIERGATTLWECWGEEGHNNTHGPRSLSHPFMGGYDNWLYNTLAGIRIDCDNPGFNHIILEPQPIDGIDWVRCHHDTPFGRVESNWRMDGGLFVWDIVIPNGCQATATTPLVDDRFVLGAGHHQLRGRPGEDFGLYAAELE